MSDITKQNNCGTGCGCASDPAPKYWQDVENKVLDKKFLSQEFPDDEFESFSVQKNRRSFLKIMGFSVAALPLTSCIKIPVRKALPYLNKVEDVIPGVANYYASTFQGTPILVKTREGRPIKIEGNEKSSLTGGGTGARVQASVISLYDDGRKTSPTVNGNNVEYDQFDAALKKDLELNASAAGRAVLVTGDMSSPSELALINEFKDKYGFEHIAYEPVSYSAMADANKLTHGSRSKSEFNFENANVVVSFGADFLGTWGHGEANARAYSRRRNVEHPMGMNRHFHFEATMSMTGANADYRFTSSQSEQKQILAALYSKLAGTNAKVPNKYASIVNDIAKQLNDNKGKSLVVAGNNELDVQVVVNKINSLLGNYQSTVFVYNRKHEVVADDAAFEKLVKDMNGGKVKHVFLVGVNPAYDYYNSEAFLAGLKKVKTSVSFTLSDNETSTNCKYVSNMNHTYESWSDSMVTALELSLTQPVIQPLFGSRMWTESLMSLMGKEGSFYDYMKANWAGKIDWNKTLHDGVATIMGVNTVASDTMPDVSSYAGRLTNAKAQNGLNIMTYVKYGIGKGDMSNNPFLQELPDPVTKATWDNYALISPAYAKENNLSLGDVIEINNGKVKVSVPVIVQPGTEKNTVAVAVGYGRSVAGKVAKGLGANAYPFHQFAGSFTTADSFGTVTKTGKKVAMAQTQTHHSMEGRDIIRETTYENYKKNPKSGNEVKKPKTVHIYPTHKKDGHQWGMAIDLTSCTGCSSCIVSCSLENNVPVVGKKEVAMRREMHWLRIDRYYSGDENQPEVAHMPMMCQHCENAPCENVCPVLATVHSSDGINQQIYNRCVGTRYCANNCPYKVRRFNWFNYDRGSDLDRMALNPDISVRSRGIMEKCSLCIQRIQEGKLTAKRERRKLKDGDIKTACQQSCPTDGIVFGDINDPNSKISKYLKLENNLQQLQNDRGYNVLEELNVQPRVSYLTKIRNK